MICKVTSAGVGSGFKRMIIIIGSAKYHQFFISLLLLTFSRNSGEAHSSEAG